jgi:hypothetical protein
MSVLEPSVPPLAMFSEFVAPSVRLSMVTFRTSNVTAELGALITTLYVVPPLLLGTVSVLQFAALLQFPVVSVHVATTS